VELRHAETKLLAKVSQLVGAKIELVSRQARPRDLAL